MNRTKLKNYAPQARRDFIAAVTNRAAYYGLTENQIEPITEQGDVAIIGGRAFPRTVAPKRKRLEDRIARHGFAQVMEAMAYTWFNRLVAIRFMELHGYLDHGYRVLSHPEGKDVPEIVEHAEHVELPGLNTDTIIDLKLDGTKEAELYRLLLIAQCNALHDALPFLFERIDDETELLLPDNLLHSDSLIRKLVNEIDEEDWREIEIIGWLYQFYISEKKDQVIGKVVKSEDIPAATQLFTPNWIVKYMVHNSLGAQWLATYPDSSIKQHMEYYIKPAEQTDEVKAQLAAITPNTLNPEELTLIDPACGSGHILVEAYELFKAIYLERGYRQRDVVQLILEKNLFGLDIDERAAQLTGFVLMMKGRADDRRLFERGVKLNVMALVDSTGFDAERLARGVGLADYGLQPGDLTELRRLFEHATTFGSLIQVPEDLAAKLPALKKLSEATSQDLFVSDALKRMGPLVRQAELLAVQYDAVVANPPYMGGKGMNALVKKFAKSNYPNTKSDTFTMFVERYVEAVKNWGSCAFVTPYTWMFLSTHGAFRSMLYSGRSIRSLVKPSYTSFFESAIVPLVTFIVTNRIENLRGRYTGLGYLGRGDEQASRLHSAINGSDEFPIYETSYEELLKIPSSPVAYWVSDSLLEVFNENPCFETVAPTRKGMVTARNHLYVRGWHEVSTGKSGFDKLPDRDTARSSKLKWFSYLKGGGYRKWSGNKGEVVDWENDGFVLQTAQHPSEGRVWATNFNLEFIFKSNVNWGAVTSSDFSARLSKGGELFDAGGSACFPVDVSNLFVLGFLNSKVTKACLSVLNPTLNFQAGNVANLPLIKSLDTTSVRSSIERLVSANEADWNSYERSWDFQSPPFLIASSEFTPTLESSYIAWVAKNRDTIAEMKRLEEENNRLFINAYGLADELTPDVPLSQITLTVNPAYRYGGKLTEEEQWTRFRQDTMEELVSYAIGCMMGRYSLDEPGLIYASSNVGFDATRYTTFPADSDGIVPLTDSEWFDDDAAHRLIKFISVAWDAVHLEDNLTFLADNLSPNKNESSRETLRRYLCDSFFKDHLQTYKNRPIYWLFSSGKQRAFQCLVYLHRYNDGTLSRMRTEYVIPLQGKIAARIDQLKADVEKATSTSHSRKLEKERDTFLKQQTELHAFDEKLRHYADQRISLDLDDGVKVNYGKFGDLLAEVKAVTGKA